MSQPGGEKGKPEKKPKNPNHNPIKYRYNIDQSLRLRNNLVEILSEFEGKTPRGEKFARLVQLVWENLPLDASHFETLERSLAHCAGTLMTKDLLYDTAWRMAGNIPRLRHNKPVPPWHGQQLDEWIALHIVSCRRVRVRDRVGAEFGLRVVGGTSTPRLLFQFWSLKYCRVMARDFGFSRARPWRDDPGKYSYEDPEQLVGLRLYGLVDKDESGAEPVITTPAWPPVIREHNREVIKRRARIDPGYTCPQGLPPHFKCQNCPVGFRRCPAGTHKLDWEPGFCPQCKQKQAMFDPELNSEVCIDCHNSNAYKVKK